MRSCWRVWAAGITLLGVLVAGCGRYGPPEPPRRAAPLPPPPEAPAPSVSEAVPPENPPAEEEEARP